MKVEELEKQKPEVKLENFRKWLADLEERAEDYVAEQKKKSDSDKSNIEFPESIPAPKIEMFVESTESNLESLHERLRILREQKRVLPFEGVEVSRLIEKFLDDVGGFINKHRLEPKILEWLIRPGSADELDKLMDFTSEVVSRWEQRAEVNK